MAMPWAFLSGYRTYIVAAAMILAALTQLLGINLPNFESENAANLLMEAFALIFLRKGIKGQETSPSLGISRT